MKSLLHLMLMLALCPMARFAQKKLLFGRIVLGKTFEGNTAIFVHIGEQDPGVRRYGWTMRISLNEGSGNECWFPPDGLPMSGISLSPTGGGCWNTTEYDGSEGVEASPESLETYLSRAQPYVA